MIDFHGATIPRGLQRTWPQVMSVEAVRGEENGQNPTRDIFLAFTRNIVGSMDYTPTWFSRPTGRTPSRANWRCPWSTSRAGRSWATTPRASPPSRLPSATSNSSPPPGTRRTWSPAGPGTAGR